MKLNEAKQILKKAGYITEAINPKKLPKTWNYDKILDLADLIRSGADVPMGYYGEPGLSAAVQYIENADDAELNDPDFKAAAKIIKKDFYKKVDAAAAEDLPDPVREPGSVLKGDAPRPSNDDRAEDDSDYMGTSYEYYDLDDPCTDEDWADAGRQWAKDMLNNGEFSKQDYKDALWHYHVYEFEDDWEPSDED